MQPMPRMAAPISVPLERWMNQGATVLDPTGQPAGTFRTTEEARRFVAAMNAVAGMPTDALEAWTTGVISDPVQELAAELAAMIEFVPYPDDRRRSERRQGEDRRRFTAQVRIDTVR
jgi:hypothetical protein